MLLLLLLLLLLLGRGSRGVGGRRLGQLCLGGCAALLVLLLLDGRYRGRAIKLLRLRLVLVVALTYVALYMQHLAVCAGACAGVYVCR
jgi:hypothetical protein